MMLKPPPVPVAEQTDGETVYLCPFCEDRSGHFRLNKAKGLYHCYRCGRGGKVSTLRRLTGVDWPGATTPLQEDQAVTLDSVLDLAFGGALPGAACSVRFAYQSACSHAQDGELLPYGLNRTGMQAIGLTETTTACSSLPQEHPVARYLQDRGVPVQQQDAWGLSTDCTPKARYFARVVFPSIDPLTGRLRTLTGRAIYRSGPRYLGPATRPEDTSILCSPYARSAIRYAKQSRFVLVEGPFDAVKVDALGFPTIALCGMSVTRTVAQELLQWGVRDVVVMLDSTASNESLTAVGVLAVHGITAAVARLDAKDPDAAPPEGIRAALDVCSRVDVTDIIREVLCGNARCK